MRYNTSEAKSFFFFNDTATTEIYTLSLHDALPIWWTPPTTLVCQSGGVEHHSREASMGEVSKIGLDLDRKSTRLNSSHANISYAVFCLKKKKPSVSHAILSPCHTPQSLSHPRLSMC